MITNEQIETFVSAVNEMLAENNAKAGYKWDTFVEADIGKKRVRIVKRERWNGVVTDNRSAFCFVDLESGAILKAASWATPAKHARGNIANGAKDLTQYGAVYLR